MILNEEKPVAAPRYVTGDRTNVRHLDGDGLGFAVTGHVNDGHSTVRLERGRDDAHWCFNAMLAGDDPAHMRKRHYQPDCAMAAHTEVADIVEEYDASRASRIVGRNEQRTDKDIRAARFVDDGRAESVVLLTEELYTLSQRTCPHVGDTADDHAGWLAAGVGVYYLNAFQEISLLIRYVNPWWILTQ